MADDVATSSSAVPPGRDAAGQRIGLFVQYEFHAAILNPLYALLKDGFPCLITNDAQSLIAFQPKVLVMSDRPPQGFRRALPQTMFVGTRHGFGSKNYARVHLPDFDFVSMPSAWAKDESIAQGCLPRLSYWVTGFVPTDSLLRPDSVACRPDLPADFAAGGPTLLYAPTWNPYLRSIEMLGADWITALRETLPEVNIIVKPHPHNARYPAAMAIVQKLVQQHERTLLVDAQADVYPYFLCADVLLTDVSSVMFYYLALDRPIVLVNNPLRFEDPKHFDPQGEEWRWRDMALQIDRPDDLSSAVCRSLAQPEEMASQRAVYRGRIFGDLVDGRAAERLAAKIRALLRPTDQEREWVDLAWNSLAQLNRMAAAVAVRPSVGKAIEIPLASFPVLKAAIKQAPQCQTELEKLVRMVVAWQSGQARPLGPQQPAQRPEERR